MSVNTQRVPPEPYESGEYVPLTRGSSGGGNGSTMNTSYTVVSSSNVDMCVVEIPTEPEWADGLYLSVAAGIDTDSSGTGYARVYDATNAVSYPGTEVTTTNTSHTPIVTPKVTLASSTAGSSAVNLAWEIKNSAGNTTAITDNRTATIWAKVD